MIYYVASTLAFFVLCFMGWLVRAPRYFLVLALLPMAFLAILRGTVGMDTATYIQTINQLLESGSFLGVFEPLFEGLVLTLSMFTDSAALILALIGVMITLLLVWAGMRHNSNPYLFCLLVVPVYYFDMVMNGVRYGLAFSLVYLAGSFLLQRRYGVYFALVLVAGMIQVSSLMLGLLLFILYTRQWRWVIYGTVFLAVFVGVFFNYLLAKLTSYAGLQVASGLSGLSTVLVSWLLLAIWALDVQARRHSGLVILLLAGLTVVMIGVSQFSYAGIRLQQLVNFLIIMCLIFHTARYEIQLAPFTKVAILLVALMAFAFRMKNFADTAGIGSSPFVPYLFFWE
ncbi:EpsG family protein [Pseudomonas monteilii]|uniref:EpsG family protein n=2 Tax=Pseudomonas monteilii TaxID=76759 RepID=A0AAP7FKR5_9PSED|nr:MULTISPECIES: EpsG family protein [Pseudomonas]AYN14921.1 EpsG family protein [Pseudomonas monteilii]AYO01468.1 EpsG family protein [Pseudomonas sp. LTGT-11-2Z]MBA6101173.1 EpsG family protein [Pseudomonas monteilii]MCE0872659.1 EpsG family protein [Pseudomonas monteilii]MCE0927537.1 EpsG family protein [Pseudomonas monteilii]